MGDQRPSSTDAIDVHSDEERKPSPSALHADERASRRTITVNPIPDFGPKQPMPDHLVDVLDEWHKKKGKNHPPCAYGNGKVSQRWKVFDREGKELQLSKFQILSPSRYWVLVLHSSDFSGKLVKSRLPHFEKYGIFLIAWQGEIEGWEAKCCAIRIFARELKNIVYSPDAWTHPIRDMDPAGNNWKKSPLREDTERVRNQGQEREREKEPERRKRVNRPKREVATSNPNSGNASESSDETDSSADESSDGSSSSEEEEEGNVTAPTVKRRRVQQQPSNMPARTRKATNPAKVTFKLVSYKSGAIRAFPLEECKTGRDLFNKARTFFRLFDRNADVTILSCQISSERAQHFLFGSEGEFELLIKQAKDSKSTEDGTVTIEVNHVLEP